MAGSGWLHRAAERAAVAVDRSALRLMERAMTGGRRHHPDGRLRERLVELARHYGTPNMLATPGALFAEPRPAPVTEAALANRRGFDLQIVSRYRPTRSDYVDELASYHDNALVHARWLRASDEPRPVAILLHGWGGGAYWLEERLFVTSYWLHLGLDVCLVQLPFHGRRAPAQSPRSGSLFPGTNAIRTNEGFGQAISDLRRVAAHLRDRGAPAVGVFGMSLGAYTAALWASLDDDLAFVVAKIPAVDLAALMWHHGASSPMRRRAERDGISQDLLAEVFSVHAPTTRPVRVPSERLMVVAARNDHVTPPEQAQRLIEHWRGPRNHWFAGGHLAQIGRSSALRAVRDHLRDLGVLDSRPDRGDDLR